MNSAGDPPPPGNVPSSPAPPKSHRPRRRFGQNFLYEQRTIDQIIDAIAPQNHEHIVEIGPGQGALTDTLAQHAGRLDIIEIDYDLHRELESRYANVPRVNAHRADILRFDLNSIVPEGTRCRIVGNLPYNISTPLLFRMFDAAARIHDMHFMLQREVVDRLVSTPGRRDYGRLSIMTQYRCHITRLFNVSPHAFRPVPKVTSSVARLLPHLTPPVAVASENDLREVVTQCFTKRRKTLRNCLKGYLTETEITQCNIDPGHRPQTLSLADFAGLANAYTAKKVTHRNCG